MRSRTAFGAEELYRVGRVRDPFGDLWWIRTHPEDVTEEEMGRPAFSEVMA
ncbi:hypothetical protein P3L51_35325 [Streptomyces sp. PSRA5]|uniref:hypothetical protein n=1 Tax=Streptomyces panacea TaxID=3035064 RepID=UPI00339BAC12